ncbi:MAG TPA: penicillin-binding protein 1A [Casimicrobiaceae bacterium]|jgi:penicillin-binding protein 1A|nr:penicillin-binding protein 1A [Casimicrobiaceae bacterium]
MLKRWLIYLASVLFGLALVGTLLVAFVFALLYPTLPTLEALTDYQPKIPLRILSAEGELLGEFGEERRAVVKIKDVPNVMREAILAAEDERFYQHGGVDYISVLRAALANAAGGTQQGAGTITMQVARNFFLTRERTLTRKLREVLLAYKIEANLSKDQILELYVNQIFLGQRAYGFAAAAQIYFGKPLSQIDVAEAAMLAGLPKAPSAYNPVANPKRARTRQFYVLRRMHELHYITDAQLKEAQEAPLVVRQTMRDPSAHAEYIAEMVRQAMFDTYGEDCYTRGLTVYTTIRKADQDAAYAAVRRGVFDYDRRHGYRGPEGYVSLPDDPAELEQTLDSAFQDLVDSDNLEAAIVLAASPAEVKAVRSDGDAIAINGDGLKFAARALSERAPAGSRIRRGAVIRVNRDDKAHWQISQLPQAESALVSARPSDGAILALVGGFDFDRNKYNHVVQAQRQPGSAFKPFIYSAALEKGFSPATVVNDAPLYFDATQTGSEAWEPKNYDGKFEGPMRLRTALMKSKNLVTVRVMQAIGPQYAQDYIARFGFDPKLHPAYLPMALGAGAATPLQMLGAYAVFANGGYRVTPYFIDRVVDARGSILSSAQPAVAAQGAERAIDPRNAFIMTTMLRDVVRGGTAARAMQLGRQDLAGKTGTTNENIDAWFCGFNAAMVTVTWIGFDQPKTLGSNETGAVAALPTWMNYMGKVLKGVPEVPLAQPEGIVVARINADTGLREVDDRGGISEYFYAEYPPRAREDLLAPGSVRTPGEIRNQLF